MPRWLARRLVVEQGFLARQSLFGAAFRQHVGDGLGLPMRHAPGGFVLVIAVADVKDLAQRLGAIAVRHEMLRNRHRLRRGGAEVRA
jgi:hypothetical protein